VGGELKVETFFFFLVFSVQIRSSKILTFPRLKQQKTRNPDMRRSMNIRSPTTSF